MDGPAPLLALIVGLSVIGTAVVVLRVVLIVIHELGHALAGLTMGMPAREISIGAGEARARAEVGGVQLTLRRLGVGFVGYVLLRPTGSFAFRVRHSIVLLAGVGAEVVVWFVVVGEPFPPAPVWIASLDGAFIYGVITFTLFLLIIHDVIANLVPMTIGGVANDGIRLVAVLNPRNSIEQQHRQHQQLYRLAQAVLDLERGQVEEALVRLDAELAAATSADPFDPGASDPARLERRLIQRIRASSLIQLLRYDEAVEASAEAWSGARAAADGDLKLENEAVECGGLHAYALALAGSDLDRALELAVADVARDRSPATRHTLGAVLVHGADPARGVDLLTATLPAAPTDVDRMETHRFLAIGRWQLGEIAAASDHVRSAIEAYPAAADHRLQDLPEAIRPPRPRPEPSAPPDGGHLASMGQGEPDGDHSGQDDRGHGGSAEPPDQQRHIRGGGAIDQPDHGLEPGQDPGHGRDAGHAG
jgi:hypothetical protein